MLQITETGIPKMPVNRIICKNLKLEEGINGTQQSQATRLQQTTAEKASRACFLRLIHKQKDV